MPFLYKVDLSFKVIVALLYLAGFASTKLILVLILIEREAYNRVKGLAPRALELI